jgi:hypothetical protein
VRVRFTAGLGLTELFAFGSAPFSPESSAGVSGSVEDGLALLTGRAFLVPIGVLVGTFLAGVVVFALGVLEVVVVLFNFAGAFLTGAGVLAVLGAFLAGAVLICAVVVGFLTGVDLTGVFFAGCEDCFVASATLEMLSMLAV